MHDYRADIDGLRAVAIVPVALFHAGISAFSGGVVSVDVFFVISGLLTTGLIRHKTDAGGFSLASFYPRRVRMGTRDRALLALARFLRRTANTSDLPSRCSASRRSRDWQCGDTRAVAEPRGWDVQPGARLRGRAARSW